MASCRGSLGSRVDDARWERSLLVKAARCLQHCHDIVQLPVPCPDRCSMVRVSQHSSGMWHVVTLVRPVPCVARFITLADATL